MEQKLQIWIPYIVTKPKITILLLSKNIETAINFLTSMVVIKEK